MCLFASPTCNPWGNNSRGWDKQKRRKERMRESSSLQFLAMLCFLQVLLGAGYLLENPKGSDIFTDSPLQPLQNNSLPYETNTLDQCAYGAALDEGPIRKSTDLASDRKWPVLEHRCDGLHKHIQLRGTNKKGALTGPKRSFAEETVQRRGENSRQDVHHYKWGENSHQGC